MMVVVVCASTAAFPAAAQQTAADSSGAPAPVADAAIAADPGTPPASSAAGQETPPAHDAEAADDNPGRMIVEWRDGLRMTSADGRFEMRLGGRLHTDVSYLSDELPFDGQFGTIEDGLEVRRARLFVQGRMYGRLEYKFDLDFAGGTVGGRDLYIGVRELPVLLRFGHVKEPYSLEELNSSNFITFMERSIANLFAPSRNTGILVGGEFADERLTWQAGVFRDTDGFAASTGDNYNVSGRLTWTPVRPDDGSRLLHLAGAVQHRFVDGLLSLSARPGDHNAPKIIEIRIPATAATFVNFEAAASIGSLHMQGEYNQVFVKSSERDDPELHGYYFQAAYFLTGERRPYRTGGTFDRVRPRANFLDGGPGAWEVGVRYAKIDLTEGVIQPPGELSDVTLGVNWYWNPHVRWMFNFEIDNLPDIETETLTIFHTRLQFDF